MNPMNITPEEKKIVDEALAKLLEHFDTAQIFVTGHDGGKKITSSYDAGGGNFYARHGQIIEWTETQSQYNRTYADIKQRQALDDDEKQ